MITVELQYGIILGKGDGSDWFHWEITLDGAEEAAYLRAKKLWLDPNECLELEGVLAEAYEEIKEQETQNLIDCGDEYAMECAGQVEMDPDELNDLVADRDPHALEFFGLTDADEDGWRRGTPTICRISPCAVTSRKALSPAAPSTRAGF